MCDLTFRSSWMRRRSLSMRRMCRMRSRLWWRWLCRMWMRMWSSLQERRWESQSTHLKILMRSCLIKTKLFELLVSKFLVAIYYSFWVWSRFWSTICGRIVKMRSFFYLLGKFRYLFWAFVERESIHERKVEGVVSFIEFCLFDAGLDKWIA